MNEFERIRYFAARRIWPMRDEAPPSVQRGKPMGEYTDWKGWFFSRFGESLEDFADRAKRERFGERV